MQKLLYLINNSIFFCKITTLAQTIFIFSMAIIVSTLLKIFKFYLYKISDKRIKEKVLNMFEAKNVFQEFTVTNQTLKKVPDFFIKEQYKFLNIYDTCSFYAELRNNETIHIIANDKYGKTIYNNTIKDYKYFLAIFVPVQKSNIINKED